MPNIVDTESQVVEERGGTRWKAGQPYIVGDVVMTDSVLAGTFKQYYCTVTHTSSSFAVDIANWSEIVSSATDERGGVFYQPSTVYLIGDIITANDTVSDEIYIAIESYTSASVGTPAAFVLEIAKWKKLEAGIIWRNEWVDTSSGTPDPYAPNEMARDGRFTGIANRITSEHIAPQNLGLPLDSFDKSLLTTMSTAAIVQTRHNFVFSESGYIDLLEILVPAITPTTRIKVSILNVTTGELRDQTVDGAVLDAWRVVPTDLLIVTAGDNIVVETQTYDTASADSFLSSSLSNVANTVPLDQEFYMDDYDAPTIIQLDYTDSTGSDRTVEYNAVTINSIITIQEQGDTDRAVQVQVLSSTPGVGSITFNVSVVAIGSRSTIRDNKDCIFIFETVAALSGNYSEQLGYYAVQPPFAVVTTSLLFNNVDQGAPVDSAYGINIRFQNATISTHWDLVAISDSSGNASGDGPAAAPTSSGTNEYDATATYEIDEQMWVASDERSTFKNLYRNDTTAVIGPETLDLTKWTKISSSYEDEWGPAMTQTGVISGGVISFGALKTQVDVASGEGLIVNKTDVLAPAVTRVTWAAVTLDVPDIATDRSYEIVVDATGTVILVVPPVPSAYYNGAIRLGFIASRIANPTEIAMVQVRPITVESLPDSILGVQALFIKTQLVAGGLISAGALLEVAAEKGEVYGYNINYGIDPTDPHATTTPPADPVPFIYTDSVGNGTLTTISVDPTLFEDINGTGTVRALDGVAEIASIQTLYYSTVYDQFALWYGQKAYSSLSDAINNRENHSAGAIMPAGLMLGNVLLGYIITSFDCVDLNDATKALVINPGNKTVTGSGVSAKVLNDLLDVVITAPAADQELTFNGTTSVWENKTPVLMMEEYANGVAYVKDQIITELGTMYRMLANATGVSYAPYGSMRAVNLGAGAAYRQDITMNVGQWVRFFSVKPYTSGGFTIAGYWGGKQSSIQGIFDCTYNWSIWNIELLTYSGTIFNKFNQISIRQPTDGAPVEFWVKMGSQAGGAWNVHFRCDASGTDNGVTFDAPITTVGTPTAPGGHLIDGFPSNADNKHNLIMR